MDRRVAEEKRGKQRLALILSAGGLITSEDSAEGPRDMAAREAVMDAFQKTMQDFLHTQQTVIGRMLSNRSAVSLEGEATPIAPSGENSAPIIVGRYVMRGIPTPLPASASERRLKGLYLVSGDDGAIRGAVVEELRRRGASAEPIATTLLRDPERWSAALEKMRDIHGPVCGIVHLCGLFAEPMPSTLDQWRSGNSEGITSLFRLLQTCAADLKTGGYCLALSSLDGSFGRHDGLWQGSPSSGACAGILKTASIEWPSLKVKAVDLSGLSPLHHGPVAKPPVRSPVSGLASVVIAELLALDDAQEIGYREGSRLVFEAALEPLPVSESSASQHAVPAADWVALATGGARGITAEAVAELLIPGMTLALVGRAPEPADEDPLTRDFDDVADLRSAFLRQAKSTGQSFSPAQIEKQISALRRDRAIRENLEAFRQLGVHVEYYAADVRDPEQFGAIIDSLYARYGRIDAVLHGAGVIEDKLIVDKTLDSFDRVFGTKADSTFILAQKLRPETLQWLIFFTSVAGRTGNRGQGDYAAANETVNRFAWWLQYRWPHVRVKAFNWGPWESGMASDEVNRQFRERGVIPIPPQAGREFLLREMVEGQSGEVELIAGIFDFEKPQPLSSKRFPFLRSHPRAVSDTSIECEHVFSLQHEPYLLDHQIDGVSVVPAAAALELMAEVVQAGWPHLQIAEALSHRVLRGITLPGGSDRRFLVRARISSTTPLAGLTVSAEMVDAAQPASIFYRAEFTLRAQLASPPAAPPPMAFASAGYSAAEAYHRQCFHGPRLQLLKTIVGADQGGMHAIAPSTRLAGWLANESSTEWIFNPGLVDAAVQAQMIWCRTHFGANMLPSLFARVTRFGTLTDSVGPLHLFLTITNFTATTIRNDWHWADEQGRIWLKGEGMEVTVSKALNRLVKSPPPVPIITFG